MRGAVSDYKPESDPSKVNELRLRLSSILGADRWVPGAFPTVAPTCIEETSKLLRGYSGSVMVVGSGSSFPGEFNPGRDTLILLTNRLKEQLDISEEDQTLTVSSGWEVPHVNSMLREAGFYVLSLTGLDKGTIGGRLAAIPSRPALDRGDGWIQSLLGLIVVLPSGEVVELGGRCIKDVAGYDMRHFFTGSRGTVGVIVKSVFRCRPLVDIDNNGNSQDLAQTGSYDPQWKRVFDPFSRMRPGS